MGRPTLSAHPARFSPDDKFSKQRVVLKKRFGLLPTQQPKEVCWRKTQWTDLTITWKHWTVTGKYWTKRRLSWWHCWHFVSSVYFVYSQSILIIIVKIFILSWKMQNKINHQPLYFLHYFLLVFTAFKIWLPCELEVYIWK